MDNPEFALIENDIVTQYPITYEDINAANDPSKLYVKCYDSIKPVIDNNIIDFYKKEPIYMGPAFGVHVIYSIARKTIEEVFVDIGLVPGNTLTINDITQEQLDAMIILVKERAQLDLDTFAQTKGYDDIKSVCTYINSNITQYHDEAIRAIDLRDTTWQNLYNYLNQLLTGALPLPTSWSEIQAYIPVLTWTV